MTGGPGRGPVTDVASPTLCGWDLTPRPKTRTVCFFVLCKRHWINRVPGAHQGKFPVYTLRDSLSQRKNIYSLTGKGQD